MKIISEFIKGELILFDAYNEKFEGYHGEHKHIILDKEDTIVSIPQKFIESMVIVISGKWNLTTEGSFEPGMHGKKKLLEKIKLIKTTEKLDISEVVLFKHAYFRGDHHHIFGLDFGHGDANLSLTKMSDGSTWNNQLTSVIVRGGIWEFCNGYKYDGTKWNTLGPAFYSAIETYYLIDNDAVSSIRLLTPTPRINLNEIIIFSATDFEGAHHHIFSQETKLSKLGMSEKIRSVIVKSGNWKFYANNNFKGAASPEKTLRPGMYPVLETEDLEDIKIASSVRQEYVE